MNKNTIIYGLLALGGVLAYYSWKLNSLSVKQNSTSVALGTFADDVPVNPKVLGIEKEDKGLNLGIKNSVSQIIEPFVAMIK